MHSDRVPHWGKQLEMAINKTQNELCLSGVEHICTKILAPFIILSFHPMLVPCQTLWHFLPVLLSSVTRGHSCWGSPTTSLTAAGAYVSYWGSPPHHCASVLFSVSRLTLNHITALFKLKKYRVLAIMMIWKAQTNTLYNPIAILQNSLWHLSFQALFNKANFFFATSSIRSW